MRKIFKQQFYKNSYITLTELNNKYLIIKLAEHFN